MLIDTCSSLVQVDGLDIAFDGALMVDEEKSLLRSSLAYRLATE